MHSDKPLADDDEIEHDKKTVLQNQSHILQAGEYQQQHGVRGGQADDAQSLVTQHQGTARHNINNGGQPFHTMERPVASPPLQDALCHLDLPGLHFRMVSRR